MLASNYTACPAASTTNIQSGGPIGVAAITISDTGAGGTVSVNEADGTVIQLFTIPANSPPFSFDAFWYALKGLQIVTTGGSSAAVFHTQSGA